jgi:ribosome-associated protein
MFFETSFYVSSYACVKKTFFILNNVYKPTRRFHATIIAEMNKIIIPFFELNFSFSRSSGPGGQNVNKVNSKVTMTWDPAQTSACSFSVLDRFRKKYSQYLLDDGRVQLSCQESRSQKVNIETCILKLQAMLDDVAVPPKNQKTN